MTARRRREEKLPAEMLHEYGGRADRELQAAAQRLQALRHLRRRHFPELSDRELDLLLAVFSARQQGVEVTTALACREAGLPLTSGLRWAEKLELAGLMRRFASPHDHRLALVRLTEHGDERLCVMLRDL